MKSIKKFGLFITVVSLLTFFSFLYAHKIYSQETWVQNIEVSAASDDEFTKAYDDYRLKIEYYNKVHEDYLLKKSLYFKYLTLASKTDALNATSQMLQARDDVVISYLNLMKVRLKTAVGIEGDRMNSLNAKIDDDLNWYKDHKDKIPSAGSLEDLVKDSRDAKLRYDNFNSLAYEALSNISLGKVIDYDRRLRDVFTSVKNKVNTIRSETRADYTFSQSKLDVIDGWEFESDSRISRSEDKQNESQGLIGKMSAKKTAVTVGDYNVVINTIGEAHQYLKESSLYIKEIVNLIRSAE